MFKLESLPRADQTLSFLVLVGFLWLLVDAFLIPAMVRAKQAEIRDRLITEALGGVSSLP